MRGVNFCRMFSDKRIEILIAKSCVLTPAMREFNDSLLIRSPKQYQKNIQNRIPKCRPQNMPVSHF